jgi:hypothetical protein
MSKWRSKGAAVCMCAVFLAACGGDVSTQQADGEVSSVPPATIPEPIKTPEPAVRSTSDSNANAPARRTVKRRHQSKAGNAAGASVRRDDRQRATAGSSADARAQQRKKKH